MRYNIRMLTREDFKKTPSGPGIYFFKDKSGKTLYIGKAQNLKLRLLSYADLKMVEPRKRQMLKEAKKIEWRELESDIEALIEEAIAIKRYKPRYNVLFRDDKQYFFVGFTRSASPWQARKKFPKIFLTHQKKQLKSTSKLKTINYKLKTDFIGPFTDGGALKMVMRSLQKIFPYCTCKEKHNRPCVRSEIGRCLGICCIDEKYANKSFNDRNQREKTYAKNIRAIKNVLSGKKQNVVKNTECEMKAASKTMRFEDARKLRDQIFSLENIFRHQAIIKRELDPERHKALTLIQEMLSLPDIPHRIEGYDISNLQGSSAVGSMVVFEEGKPKKSDYRLFKIRLKADKGSNDTAMIQEMLSRRLKHDEWPLPDLFLIDGGLGQFNAAKKVLQFYNLTTPLASLAKREEELWINPQKKLKLKKLPPSLLFLFQHIRNEAHRFAINFHRKRRSKAILKGKPSILTL